MRQQDQNPNIDQQWFKQQLADRQLSVRRLAKLLEISPSAASLMLRGISKIPDHLIAPLADLFSVDTSEIYKRAGVSARHEERLLKVTHYLGADRHVHLLEPGDQFDIPTPPSVGPSGFGIQIRALGLYEHWLLFASGLQCNPNQVLDRLCLYQNEQGQLFTSIVRAGYTPGTYDSVSAFNDGTVIRDVQIVWAMRIAWIKPGIN